MEKVEETKEEVSTISEEEKAQTKRAKRSDPKESVGVKIPPYIAYPIILIVLLLLAVVIVKLVKPNIFKDIFGQDAVFAAEETKVAATINIVTESDKVEFKKSQEIKVEIENGEFTDKDLVWLSSNPEIISIKERKNYR